MKQKKLIPGPEKYNGHRKTFNDPNKKSKIFTYDRTNSIDDIIKAAKKTPGIGRYEVYAFDEKRIKPPKGIMNKDIRWTTCDEELFLGK